MPKYGEDTWMPGRFRSTSDAPTPAQDTRSSTLTPQQSNNRTLVLSDEHPAGILDNTTEGASSSQSRSTQTLIHPNPPTSSSSLRNSNLSQVVASSMTVAASSHSYVAPIRPIFRASNHREGSALALVPAGANPPPFPRSRGASRNSSTALVSNRPSHPSPIAKADPLDPTGIFRKPPRQKYLDLTPAPHGRRSQTQPPTTTTMGRSIMPPSTPAGSVTRQSTPQLRSGNQSLVDPPLSSTTSSTQMAPKDSEMGGVQPSPSPSSRTSMIPKPSAPALKNLGTPVSYTYIGGMYVPRFAPVILNQSAQPPITQPIVSPPLSSNASSDMVIDDVIQTSPITTSDGQALGGKEISPVTEPTHDNDVGELLTSAEESQAHVTEATWDNDIGELPTAPEEVPPITEVTRDKDEGDLPNAEDVPLSPQSENNEAPEAPESPARTEDNETPEAAPESPVPAGNNVLSKAPESTIPAENNEAAEAPHSSVPAENNEDPLEAAFLAFEDEDYVDCSSITENNEETITPELPLPVQLPEQIEAPESSTPVENNASTAELDSPTILQNNKIALPPVQVLYDQEALVFAPEKVESEEPRPHVQSKVLLPRRPPRSVTPPTLQKRGETDNACIKRLSLLVTSLQSHNHKLLGLRESRDAERESESLRVANLEEFLEDPTAAFISMNGQLDRVQYENRQLTKEVSQYGEDLAKKDKRIDALRQRLKKSDADYEIVLRERSDEITKARRTAEAAVWDLKRANRKIEALEDDKKSEARAEADLPFGDARIIGGDERAELTSMFVDSWNNEENPDAKDFHPAEDTCVTLWTPAEDNFVTHWDISCNVPVARVESSGLTTSGTSSWIWYIAMLVMAMLLLVTQWPIFQHLQQFPPNTCHVSERPLLAITASVLDPPSMPVLVSMQDRIRNESKPPEFDGSGFPDHIDDLQPLGEPIENTPLGNTGLQIRVFDVFSVLATIFWWMF
ncbi:hypothetical protein V8E51_015793 [Hyaloscypha variabilis]